MDVYEAARLLDDMVRQGEPIGRKATAVHLFGIMYADELKRLKPRRVIEESSLKHTWEVELRKGMSLAKYVTIIQPIRWRRI